MNVITSTLLPGSCKTSYCYVTPRLLKRRLLAASHSRFFSFSPTCAFRDTSYYDDLGLSSLANSKEIKAAYYDLSKKYHPDKNADNPEALQKFQAISEAYATLGDPRLRRQYDKGVLGRSTSVADRELSKHRFKGEEFVQGRAKFRDEYRDDAGGVGPRHSGQNMDQ